MQVEEKIKNSNHIQNHHRTAGAKNTVKLPTNSSQRVHLQKKAPKISKQMEEKQRKDKEVHDGLQLLLLANEILLNKKSLQLP